MTNWEIIKQTSVQGVVEYSVSNGPCGQRTFSHDFSTLTEAREKLKELVEQDKKNKEWNDGLKLRDDWDAMRRRQQEEDR